MAKRTSAQKLAALKGKSKPRKGERTTQQKLKALRESGGRERAFGTSGLPGESGPSVVGGLKSVGGKIDDALTVPNAALTTALAKSFGKDISWKNAGGDFYTSESGKHGGDTAAEAIGITNRWGKMLWQIGADPLWAVGLAKIPKAAKNAYNAGTLARSAWKGKEGAELAKSLKSLEKTGIPNNLDLILPGAGAGGPAMPKFVKAAKEPLQLGAGEKNWIKVKPGRVPLGQGFKDMQGLVNEHGRQLAQTVSSKLEPIMRGRLQGPGLPRMGAPRKYAEPSRFQVFRSRPKTPPTVTTSGVPEVRGTHVGDYFVYAAGKSGSKRTYQVAKLDEKGRLTPAGVLDGSYETSEAARNAAKAQHVKDYIGKNRRNELPDLYDPATGRGLKDEPLFDVRPSKGTDLGGGSVSEMVAKLGRLTDDAGMSRNFDDVLKTRGAREVERQKMAHTLGIKLGVGKLSKTLDTGISAGKGGSLTRGVGALAGVSDMFRLAPLAKVFRRIEDVVRHYSEDAPDAWRLFAQEHKMGDQDAVLMYTVASFRSAAMRGSDSATRAAKQQEVDDLVDMLTSAGLWNSKHDELLNYASKRWIDQRSIEGGGIDAYYVPQGATDESMRAMYKAGQGGKGKVMRKSVDLSKIRDYERTMPSPFARSSQEGYQRLLTEAGVQDDIAAKITQRIEGALDGLKVGDKRAGFAQPEELIGEMMKPELNFFTHLARRDEAHYNRVLDKQIEQLVIDEGLAHWSVAAKKLVFADAADEKLYKSIVESANLRQVPGTLSSHGVGDFLLHQFTPFFKAILTTVNPGHYVRNAWGDYSNAMVNGSMRHLRTNPLRPEGWKLAKQDADAMKKVYQIAGQEMTGAEVYALAQWMGLGRGFVKSDIIETRGFFHNAFLKKMQDLNVDRENAQRMSTFIKHMKSGDDPLTASVKSLRVHFDYNELTAFEKQTIRNVLLFYTWLKRNTMLQASGLLTRPGYTSAVMDTANAREPFPNELPYYSQSGAFPNPFGKGGIVWGNPVNDGLTKADPSPEGFRKNILSGLNPLIKYPLEWGIGQEILTGKKIDNRLEHFRKSWEGPFLGNIERTADSSLEGDKLQGFLGSLLGMTPQQNQPEKFARFAKYVKKD